MKRIQMLAVLAAGAFVGPACLPAQSLSPGAVPATKRPAQLPADSLERARKYVLWFYTSQSDSLFAHLDSTARVDYHSPRDMDDDVANLAINAGSEVAVLDEKFVTRKGNRQYWRKATFTGDTTPFLVRLVIGPRGELMGMALGPASQAPPIDP